MEYSRDVMKSTATGAAVGGVAGAGTAATIGGVGVAIVGLPLVATGAVIGGIVGLAYGLGKKSR
jgi:hypothetical protein